MRRILTGLTALALLACGGDDPTGPRTFGKPDITQVNGVTEPSGLVGMTVIIEGTELADSAHGQVYFRATDGTKVRASASSADWSSTFIIATVPQGTADSSMVWVETTGGVSDSIPFTLISASTFSPSTINWTATTPLPQPLQGLGALSLRVTRGSTRGSYVFVAGGGDTLNVATNAVYRASVEQTGALGTWSAVTQLPGRRAYHGMVVATPQTARIDTATAGHLYVIGGVDESGAAVATVYTARIALDGSVGSWRATTALPAALHSLGAVVFRGFVYVAGGATSANQPVASAWRAAIQSDGSLGAWQATAPLPQATAHHDMVNFGPYIYVVGGDTGTVAPVLNLSSGTETNATLVGRINMRDGTLAAWTATAALIKARSKHSAVVAGGSVFATSGVYAGLAGSSENVYATITADGSLSSWNGATGANTIQGVLGYALYNQAAVSFIDATGRGHVLVLGGADRASAGRASAGVVYY